MTKFYSITLAIFLIIPALVSADVIEHGGDEETIKGDGDQVPPKCQLDYPSSATSAFDVKWSCFDNFTPQEEIRTELWVFRQQDLKPVLMQSFLGFPAAARIDETVLETTNFASALPVGIKLRAVDFAGNSTTSPLVSIGTTSNAISNCSISVVTEAVEATETVTGTPSLTVSTTESQVASSKSGTINYNVSTSTEASTTNCEIDSICINQGNISFSGAFEVAESDASISGQATLNPGEIAVEVTGSATRSGNTLSQLQAEGETTVDGTPATLTISCSP